MRILLVVNVKEIFEQKEKLCNKAEMAGEFA